jgi:hypothetical protein
MKKKIISTENSFNEEDKSEIMNISNFLGFLYRIQKNVD